MKRTDILIIISAVLVSVAVQSCSFLDFDETSGLRTKEDQYRYFNSTEQMLTNVYSYMPKDLGAVSGAMRDCACDDAEYGNSGSPVQYFTNGSWSAVNTVDDAWNLYYGIRAANSFIEEVAKTDFSRYEHDVQYANWMKKLAYFPYEARVLRAHYFFELARRYGDIAMPLAVLDKEGANSIVKTSFDDVVEFIVSECDECAPMLPDSYADQPGAQIGRVTKGFAMAVKSKALLYAASPLHNETSDVEKWKRSAKAALDIIRSGIYSLDPDGCVNDISSPEIVMMVIGGDSQDFELMNFPIRFTEGKRTGPTATFPSQNLVDAFETINGAAVKLTDAGWVSDDPQFDPQKPYDNRDPRFYRTVLANGMTFKDSEIEVFEGGADHAEVTAGGSPTGYFLRKYIQETTSFIPDKTVTNKHHWVVYRYAETLLAYAESMVNAFGSPDYSDPDYPYSALWALNQVRSNAGMPETDADEFRNKLINEWRVEFAFEDHRFWDVRRWKIGDETQRELVAVSIRKDADGTLNFYRQVYENRKWTDRMYFYPIPQSELFKNRNLYPQNLGW